MKKIEDPGATFFCMNHKAPKPASFSVAWRDGTATVRCPSCGLSTLTKGQFQAQRQGEKQDEKQ